MEHRQWIEGVTFSGGEPFDQARALASLARMLKDEGLTVMAYSGYTAPQIVETGNRDRLDLLRLSDIVVDGPYQQDHQSAHAWKGSENQNIHVGGQADRSSSECSRPQFEIIIDPHGNVSVTGMLVGEACETLRCLAGRT
jgi:anaerobic ribonucleoside-triphosphate reductase activating protein